MSTSPRLPTWIPRAFLIFPILTLYFACLILLDLITSVICVTV
jgi:hypothetical protein